jgi:hypothetical protein
MLFFFRHAENFDAGTRERHLKDVFKDVARNSQQWGQDAFLCQVGARMHEKLIMTKAKQFSVGMAEYYSCKHHNRASMTNASNDITRTLPHNKMYVISYHETNIPMDGIRLHCLSNRNESQYSDSPSNPILVG